MTDRGVAYLDPQAAAVVEAAAARLIPGPRDDPDEPDPGAREAGAVDYVDALLAQGEQPRPWRRGPWSDRHGGDVNHLAGATVDPTPAQADAWRQRIADWRQRYAAGVALLDRLAGGDFATADGATQDQVLASDAAAGFRELLFDHAIEALYALPEYGGNRDGAGWRSVRFHGDTQPEGFAPGDVARGRPDPVDRGELDEVLASLPLSLRDDRGDDGGG